MWISPRDKFFKLKFSLCQHFSFAQGFWQWKEAKREYNFFLRMLRTVFSITKVSKTIELNLYANFSSIDLYKTCSASRLSAISKIDFQKEYLRWLWFVFSNFNLSSFGLFEQVLSVNCVFQVEKLQIEKIQHEIGFCLRRRCLPNVFNYIKSVKSFWTMQNKANKTLLWTEYTENDKINISPQFSFDNHRYSQRKTSKGGMESSKHPRKKKTKQEKSPHTRKKRHR